MYGRNDWNNKRPNNEKSQLPVLTIHTTKRFLPTATMNLLIFTVGFLLSLTLVAAEDDWITAKSQEEGVLPLGNTGLFYKRLEAGYGAHYPLDSATVSTMWKVVNIRNEDVEQSEQPTYGLAKDLFIPAMRLAVLHMVEGDLFDIYAPAEFGYDFILLPAGLNPGEPFTLKMTLLDIHDPDERIWALKCNLRTKEDCSPRELMYASNIHLSMHGFPDQLRKEAIRVSTLEAEGFVKSRDDYTWNQHRMFLLPQIADLEDERIAKGEHDIWQFRDHGDILPEFQIRS